MKHKLQYPATSVFILSVYFLLFSGSGAITIRGQFHVNKDVIDEYSDIIYTINASDIE
ncbi:MAG: hypothetical protein ABI462_00895 [Ignavibacteria bacterium]